MTFLLAAGCGGKEIAIVNPPSSRSEESEGQERPPSRDQEDQPGVISADIPDFLAGGSTGGDFLDIDHFPLDEIVSGGPPKDGIPALTNPAFVNPSAASYLSEDDLILGMVVDGEAKAYPENIGWWHEIVNDIIGGQPVSVTFCPLTGTGLAFNARDPASGRQFEFGVSGLLFNSNLVMYDRRDGESLYPQIIFTSVQGHFRGNTLQLLPVVETTWRTWRKLYPSTRVISENTGIRRDYRQYPYGSYRTGDWLIFSVNPSVESHPLGGLYRMKDRVLGLRHGGTPKAYPLVAMGERAAINDQIGDLALLLVWSKDAELAVPYDRVVDGQELTFTIDTTTGFPFTLVDIETGTRWNIKGEAIEGPLAGQRLRQVPAYTAFWFAWVTFWQNTEV
jgi:hypothetical protein